MKDINNLTQELNKLSLISIDKNREDIIKISKEFIGHYITLTAEFSFNGKKIILRDCNVIGNILEDIFVKEYSEKILSFEKGPKQESPDFWTTNKLYEYEIKCFTKSPGFDIANFNSYIDQLQIPGGVYKKIFLTKYLVFEYQISENKIYIKDFKFLNTWDIMGYNGKNPMTVQNKKGIWYNLRPCGKKEWIKNSKGPYLLVNKILESIEKCPNNIKDKEEKKQSIEKQFKELTDKYTF